MLEVCIFKDKNFRESCVVVLRDANPNPKSSKKILGLGLASRTKPTKPAVNLFWQISVGSNVNRFNKKTFVEKESLKQKLQVFHDSVFSRIF